MVVHIGQMSNGIPMTGSDMPKTSESTESFETVLINTGREKTDTEKPLEPSSNRDEDFTPDETEMSDTADFSNDDAVLASSVIFASQIISQPTVDIVNEINSEDDVNPLEIVSVEALDFDESDKSPVSFGEIEMTVSDFSKTDAQSSLSEQIGEIGTPFERESLAETDFNGFVGNLEPTESEVNQDSANRVVYGDALPLNEEKTIEAAQNPQSPHSRENISAENEKALDGLSEDQNEEPKLRFDGAVAEREALAASTDGFKLSSMDVTQNVQGESREPVVPVREQVVTEITRNLEDVSAFKNEISFVLNPETLGKVSIKMAVQNSILTVELSAESKETQRILASNLESIREVLKNLSTDNQIQNIAQEVQNDYLQQHTEQNGNGNHYTPEEASDGQNENDLQFTEDFLTMLDMFASEDI